MSVWRLAFRQIRRNPFRSALMVAAIATAAAAMTAVALLVTGMNSELRRTVERLGADLMVVPRGELVARRFSEALLTGKPAMFYLSPAAVQSIGRVPAVERASAQTFVETLDSARCCAGKFFVVGFNPATDFTVTPWLDSSAVSRLDGRQNSMIVGDRILLREGDEAIFYGTKFTVAGVLAPTGMGMDWTIYVPEQKLAGMIAGSKDKAERALDIPPGAASAVFVKAAPGTDLIDLAERIEQIRPDVQVVSSSTVAHAAGQQLRKISAAMVSLVVALWIMALVLSGIVFSQAVRERQTELGLLIAKGADHRFVFGLVARESAAIASAGGIVGCGLGVLAVTCLRGTLSEAFGLLDVLPSAVWTVSAAVALVALVAASATTAALAPALKLLKMDAYEAVQRG